MSNLVQRRSCPITVAPGQQESLAQRQPRHFRVAWQGAIGMIWQWLDEQRRRRNSIYLLQNLNPRLLRDIGIDRGDDIAGSVDRLLFEQRFVTGSPRDGDIDRRW